MSGAVCPSCGVAVVPGYVRCPKCHKPLPRRASPVVGGTALPESRKFPVLAIVAAGLVTLAIILFFGLRTAGKPAREPVDQAASPRVDPATPEAAANPDEPETATATPTGPTALDVAADLERALRRQRLWSTVRVIGDRVEVRSGSCADPAMTPALDSAAASFKAAGLTKLRCLEQSGRVVTDRDL